MSGILSFAEQRFATLPVSIVGNGVAVFALSIRNPGPSGTPVPGQTFIFGMSPQALHKETNQLNTVYDVSGSPAQYGVNRMVDMWGEAPPMFVVRGTFGWKRHSTDGFQLAGKQATTTFQAMFDSFAQLNQTLMTQQATQFYTMEFYDYWNNEYWQIVPIGPQGIDEAADKPIISYYTFRFAAIKAVSAPIPAFAVDAMAALFSAGAQIATEALNNLAFSVLAS